MDSNHGTRRKRVKHVKYVRPHFGPMKPMPWWEDLIGRLTGRALMWLSMRAIKRGDWHEFNHLQCAWIGGNSHHDDEHPCGLPPHAATEPVRFHGSIAATKVEDE